VQKPLEKHQRHKHGNKPEETSKLIHGEMSLRGVALWRHDKAIPNLVGDCFATLAMTVTL
jgi:hypothetical protein